MKRRTAFYLLLSGVLMLMLLVSTTLPVLSGPLTQGNLTAQKETIDSFVETRSSGQSSLASATPKSSAVPAQATLFGQATQIARTLTALAAPNTPGADTETPVSSVTASPSGDVISLDNASQVGTLKVLTGHTAEVYGVDFNLDGTKLVSGSIDRDVRLWDVASGESTQTLKGHTGFVIGVRFSPDGTKIA